jgi:hypothetical protein
VEDVGVDVDIVFVGWHILYDEVSVVPKEPSYFKHLIPIGTPVYLYYPSIL